MAAPNYLQVQEQLLRRLHSTGERFAAWWVASVLIDRYADAGGLGDKTLAAARDVHATPPVTRELSWPPGVIGAVYFTQPRVPSGSAPPPRFHWTLLAVLPSSSHDEASSSYEAHAIERRSTKLDLAGTVVEGQGAHAGDDLLWRAGADGFGRVFTAVIGYPKPRVHEHSMSAAVAVAMWSLRLGLRTPPTFVVGEMVPDDDGWHVGAVQAATLDGKLEEVPSWANVLVPKDNERDISAPLLARLRVEGRLTFVDTWESVVAALWPRETRRPACAVSLWDSLRGGAGARPEPPLQLGLCALAAVDGALFGAEVVALQEHAPKLQHIVHAQAPFGIAVLATIAAATTLGASAWWLCRRTLDSALQGRFVQFYWLWPALLCLWLPLLMLCAAPVVGDGTGFESRFWWQVPKAAFLAASQVALVLAVPLQHLAVAEHYRRARRLVALRAMFEQRSSPFPYPAGPFLSVASIGLACIVVAVLLISLQWFSWWHPGRVGYGDWWRGFHMVVQMALQLAVAAVTLGLVAKERARLEAAGMA